MPPTPNGTFKDGFENQSTQPTKESEEESLDALVRDLTAVGVIMSKSETKRRIKTLLAQALKEQREKDIETIRSRMLDIRKLRGRSSFKSKSQEDEAIGFNTAIEDIISSLQDPINPTQS